jgi:hypothetical protein
MEKHTIGGEQRAMPMLLPNYERYLIHMINFT